MCVRVSEPYAYSLPSQSIPVLTIPNSLSIEYTLSRHINSRLENDEQPASDEVEDMEVDGPEESDERSFPTRLYVSVCVGVSECNHNILFPPSQSQSSQYQTPYLSSIL